MTVTDAFAVLVKCDDTRGPLYAEAISIVARVKSVAQALRAKRRRHLAEVLCSELVKQGVTVDFNIDFERIVDRLLEEQWRR